MTNKELQQLLSCYHDNTPIKLIVDHKTVIGFTEENALLTSETAFVNSEAPEDEWDAEEGRIDLGDGPQFLLINPIIM